MRAETNRVVVHCAATDPSWHGRVKLHDIRRWHVEERGWRDIGYHLYIDMDGIPWVGRKFGAIGAHARGYNLDSFAVCLEGGLSVDRDFEGNIIQEPVYNFTLAQMQTLKVVLGLKTYGNPAVQVVGHRDLPGARTSCPSFDVIPWWETVRPTSTP